MKKICLFVSLLLSSAVASATTYPTTVTDIVGRAVTLKEEPKSIMLGTGRTVYLLDIVRDGDIFEGVIAWRDDFMTRDPDLYELYKKQFPQIANLPTIGLMRNGEFDAEYVLGLKPDVIFFDVSDYKFAKETQMIELFAQAGTQMIFIDFREDPLKNTIPSVKIVGQALNQEENAAKFVQFQQGYMQQVVTATSSISPKKRAFIERSAGYNGMGECCRTWGDNNFGQILAAAGVTNIGTELLPGDTGEITVEKLLIENPDLYILTGADWKIPGKVTEGVPLGYNATDATTQVALKKLVARSGVDQLDAVKNNQTYAIYHQFYNSPYNFIASLYFAKWAYPEAFTTLDPTAVFMELHKQFMSVPYQGQFAVRLRP